MSYYLSLQTSHGNAMDFAILRHGYRLEIFFVSLIEIALKDNIGAIYEMETIMISLLTYDVYLFARDAAG